MTLHAATRRCRAAVSDGRGDFSIRNIQVGAPGRGEVLVQIYASGICHTDFDHLTGFGPQVMGHEGAGIVLEVGSDVRTLEGDHVVLNWAIPCGRCLQCTHGATHLCEDKPAVPKRRVSVGDQPVGRSFGLGTMAELAIVRQEAVTRIPDTVPFESACILGCGVMTGFGSAVNAAQVKAGSSVAVIGVGGVGLNVVQGAKYCGADRIVAIDLHERRLQMALQLGATDVVRVSPEADDFAGVIASVKSVTDARGVDYAFECTAVPALGSAPLALVRNGGMAVAVSGIEEPIHVDMTLFEWDKIYINPLYGQCQPNRDFPLLTGLYREGRLELDSLITKTYRLDDLAQGFDDMHSGEISKGVVIPS